MTTTTTPADNGVDIEFLRQAREALTAEPEGAKFQWRVTNTWVNGTHSRSRAHDFFGLGAEQSLRSEFHFDGDHPELFSAEDNGAPRSNWRSSDWQAASPPVWPPWFSIGHGRRRRR